MFCCAVLSSVPMHVAVQHTTVGMMLVSETNILLRDCVYLQRQSTIYLSEFGPIF